MFDIIPTILSICLFVFLLFMTEIKAEFLRSVISALGLAESKILTSEYLFRPGKIHSITGDFFYFKISDIHII